MPEQVRELDSDAVKAFLDQASRLAEWYRDRADGHETKAGRLLGVAGAVVAVLSVAIAPVSRVSNDCLRWTVVAMVVLVVILFVFSALFALLVIKPRAYLFGSRPQVEQYWRKYRDE